MTKLFSCQRDEFYELREKLRIEILLPLSLIYRAFKNYNVKFLRRIFDSFTAIGPLLCICIRKIPNNRFITQTFYAKHFDTA